MMKTVPILVVLGYVLVMGACAWAAFTNGAPVLGVFAIIGALAAIFALLKSAGAWSDPKPWNGEGE